MNISDDSHPVRVGLSDAFFQALARINGMLYANIVQLCYFNTVPQSLKLHVPLLCDVCLTAGFVYGIITTYHQVDLSLRDVMSQSAIELSPLPS